MTFHSNTFKPEIRQGQIVNPARLRMAVVRFSRGSSAERATRRPLNRLVWVCLCIVLIPEFIPPLQEILASLHITLLARLAGLLGALILAKSILTDWSVYWPFLFVSYLAASGILNRLSFNQPPEVGLIDSIYGVAVSAAIYLMVIATVTSRRRFILISVLLIAGALLNTGYFFWDNYVAGTSSSEILVEAGLLANRNYLSPILLGGLIACISLLELYVGKWRRGILYFIIGGLYLGGFFTGSRGTVLATTLLIGMWLVSLKSKRRGVGLVAVGLILVGLWLFQNQEVVSYTLERLQQSNYDAVIDETRYRIIFDALDLWSENLLFGAGLGAQMQTTAHAPHMAFTGLLAETGMLGFLLFYIPTVRTLIKSFSMSRQATRRTRNDLHGVLRIFAIGLFAFLFEGLFEETYVVRNFYIHIGLLYAIMHASWLRPPRFQKHNVGLIREGRPVGLDPGLRAS